MLGTPKTKAFEEMVKTLVRAAWKAGKTDDEILAELEKSNSRPRHTGKVDRQTRFDGCESNRAVSDLSHARDSTGWNLHRLLQGPITMTTAISVFNGIPSFFRCSCQEAIAGGTHSYKWAGRALAQNLHRLVPDDMDRRPMA